MPEAAELYNAMNPWSGRSDDRFYLDLVLGAPSVLDVGCGTGTLLSQARSAGHRGRLVGVDPDADMLAQARRHADIEWMHGDMSTVSLAGFDLAVMTGHAFQCLLTDDDVLATLRGVRDALEPGGRFVFETRNPLVREWERWSESGYDFPWEGKSVRVFYEVQPIVGDVVDVVENIVADDWKRADRGQLRFISAERLSDLVVEAGLVPVAQYGDWERGPLTPDSPEIISVVQKVER
ncbi:class I SAM-dependent methyltransferase [Kutzneria sp. CA-103260]|uniref:class I SAM-dependent methyltransferase n=1 Tax=Kutzneria sp. CA-103260 TaxID=2802641 RepID=UPI001BEEE4C3|nr:class I SAM-dependent methyltransferase [Kutzneria sp. CA-103260]QUQ62715.1 methyltransferase [Kutzneria sp. CA-103260]